MSFPPPLPRFLPLQERARNLGYRIAPGDEATVGFAPAG